MTQAVETQAPENPTPQTPEAQTPETRAPEVQTVEKPCFYCAGSCAGQPRVKDKQGRYAHKSCQQALSKPEHGKRPRRARHRQSAPPPDFLADLPDLIPSIYHTVAPCPTCNQRVHPRAVLCTHCGTDLTTPDASATSAVELKPQQTAAPALSVKHTTLWILGLLTGATLGAALWTALAPLFTVRISFPEALISAVMGSAIVVLAYLSRLLGPR